jgi:hypothetical protein
MLKNLQQYFIVRGVDTTVQCDLRNSVQIKPNKKTFLLTALITSGVRQSVLIQVSGRLHLKCEGTRAETRFCLSAK